MMKTSIPLAALAIFVNVANAQLITDFGLNANDGGGWTYSAGTSTLTGTEQAGDLIFGSTSFLNYSGVTGITLDLNVTMAPNSGLTFILQDSEGDEVSATFDWNDFIGGATANSSLSINPLFDYANVIGWNLVGGGSGSLINATLDSATAVVPEPTTLALLTGSLTLGLILRRRRSA